MKKAAITGHTQGLGQAFYQMLESRGYHVRGFSRSNGYDIRDYSVVARIIDETQNYDLFVNSAKPDFVQAQILYRLARSQSVKQVLSIGSVAVVYPPDWTDTHMLEYLTQKVALDHAHRVLSENQHVDSILIHPKHLTDDYEGYVKRVLDDLGL